MKITRYQLKKQIGLVLNKNHQYNILDFDLSIPSDPKSFRDFRAKVLEKIRFFLVKVTEIIWWTIWIQMGFNRNSAYFT